MVVHAFFRKNMHIRSIVGKVPVKLHSDKELRRLYDAARKHYWVLKAGKADSSEMLLTMILKHMLDQKTLWIWVEFNNDSVPPCTKFLKLLDLHVRHLESVSHTGHKQAPGSYCKLPAKQSFVSSTDDTCQVCNKRCHQIHNCMYLKDRYMYMRKGLASSKN